MKRIIQKSASALMASAAICVGFTACIADEPMVTSATEVGKAAATGDAYFTLSITTPTTGATSRAEDPTAETTQQYDQGYDYEYGVKVVYLYFFDQNNKSIVLSTGKRYMAVSVSLDSQKDASPESPNGSATNLGVRYSTTTPFKVDAALGVGTYRVVALCNAPAATLPEYTSSSYTELDFTTLEELQNSQHSYKNIGSAYSINDNGIPMSSRSWDGKIYQTITISAENVYSKPCEISLQVERELARVQYTNNTTEFLLYSDTKYTTSIGKVILKQREILNNPHSWYLFRHVGTIDPTSSSAYTPSFASDCFGQLTSGGTSPYVITPYTSTQTTDVSKFVDNDSPMIVQSGSVYYGSPYYYRTFEDWIEKLVDGSYTGWDACGLTSQSVIGYIPENCMHSTAQKKGNVTCVLFRGELRPTSAICGLDYTTYKTTKEYTYSGSYSYNYKDTYMDYEDLYYYNGKFYCNLLGVYLDNETYFNSISVVGSSLSSGSGNYKYLTPTNCESEYGIKRYVNHMGYYFYFIKHLDNGVNGSMGPMEYAIVRNNSYDIKINRISMPAYTLNEAESIDPSEDIERNSLYMDADIVVRPWISRPQTADLGAR